MTQLHHVFRKKSGARSHTQNFVGLLTVALCILAFALPGWAGEGEKHRHGHNPEKQLKKLTKRLGLSEAQQAKIKPLLAQKAQQLESLHQQMKDVRQQTRAKIEAELTPEQAATFKDLRDKRKKHRDAHKGKHKKRHKGKHKNKGYDKSDDDKDDDDHDHDDD